ncbi:hypothetical protein bAD24_III10920 [Burkholderia sp. AD24]|nr:hypothetical protein bAD24_III10920 [Burkholderia sp. AD24]
MNIRMRSVRDGHMPKNIATARAHRTPFRPCLIRCTGSTMAHVGMVAGRALAVQQAPESRVRLTVDVWPRDAQRLNKFWPSRRRRDQPQSTNRRLVVAYLWTDCPGALEDLKAVVYDFADSRAAEHARDFLGDWRGQLVCDDFTGCKALFAQGVTELGCMAHARRKFLRSAYDQQERDCTGCASVHRSALRGRTGSAAVRSERTPGYPASASASRC